MCTSVTKRLRPRSLISPMSSIEPPGIEILAVMTVPSDASYSISIVTLSSADLITYTPFA